MINALRSEFRKLLSVRTTYFFVLSSIVGIGIINGYVYGYRASSDLLARPDFLSYGAATSMTIVGSFLVIVGMLLFTNEYRYNTILYSLTTVTRNRFLAAKTIAVIVSSLALSLLVLFSASLFSWIGVTLSGREAALSTLQFSSNWWAALAYGLGSGLLALVISIFMRNQVGALVAYILGIPILEQLLSLLIKSNAKFLPFNALSQLGTIPNSAYATLSKQEALTVVGCWILGGFVIAWLWFTRRDAN